MKSRVELEEDPFENQIITKDMVEFIDPTSLLLPVSSSLAASSFTLLLALRAPAPYPLVRDDEQSKSATAHLQLDLLQV